MARCSPPRPPPSPQDLTSTQERYGFPPPPQQMSATCSHRRSSSRMHETLISRSPSPPSLSSSSRSSDDLLARAPSNPTRGRPHRRTYHSSLPPRHHRKTSRAASSFDPDQANRTPPSRLTASSASSPKSCTHHRLPSAPCFTENQQKEAHDPSPRNPFKRRRTMDLHCEAAPPSTVDDISVAKEGDRKLVMWRAACAMAHAYLHQQNYHRPDLHQNNRPESSSPTPGSSHHHAEHDEAHENKRLQVNRQEDIPNMQWQTDRIDTLHSSSGSSNTSSKDGVSTPSAKCPVAADVVCIDEVVNPTQAAEWFGALFASTSTLVS